MSGMLDITSLAALVYSPVAIAGHDSAVKGSALALFLMKAKQSGRTESVEHA
jgi:hypothetical protein